MLSGGLLRDSGRVGWGSADSGSVEPDEEDEL